MKIFSRTVTIVATIFLVAITVFNFIHNFVWLGVLAVAFVAILLALSFKVGIWRRGKENW